MSIFMAFSTIDRQIKPTSTRMGAIAAVSDPQIQAIADALDAVILGAPIRAVKSEETIVDAGDDTPPSDEDANRGNKWLMRFQEASKGRIYTHEIGTADNTQLPSPSSDTLDLTAGVGLALKTAMDAAYESPLATTGVLLSAQQVTRTD